MLMYFILGFILAIIFTPLSMYIIYKLDGEMFDISDGGELLGPAIIVAIFFLLGWPLALPLWILLVIILVVFYKISKEKEKSK